MKKIIAAIATLSVCTFMLTACENKTTAGDSILIDNIPEAEDINNTDNDDILSDYIPDEDDAETSDTDTDETTAAEPEPESFEVSASYASLEEFACADDIFENPAEALDSEDSYTYAFMKKLEYGNEFYMDLECFESINDIPDGGEKLSMATTGDKLFMSTAYSEEDMPFIITDGKVYIVNDETRTAVYAELGEDEPAESIEFIFDEFLLITSIENDVFYGSGTMSYNTDIGGEIYTFEFNEYIGMLYDQEGNLCLKISKKSDAQYYAVRVNEISEDIPDGIFDIPSDYKMIDMLADE